MNEDKTIQRRAVLVGAATLAAAAGAAAITNPASAATSAPIPEPAPLWRTARSRGLAYGTAWATWMAGDHRLTDLQDREAAILMTQDDLLWYVLKPNPSARLDFSYGDAFYQQAKSQNQLVLGAHLV